MPVTLINGHVLLPHAADWSDPVEWQRIWQTGISTSVVGDESRQSLRSQPREQISFSIMSLSLEERSLLDARLDAAIKSGLACVPFQGRGSQLSADVNADAVTVLPSAWSWQVGDFAFFMDRQFNYDVLQVTAVDGLSFTLSDNVSRIYPAGSLVWPLLFGKISLENQNAITSWHEAVRVTVAERTASRQVSVGAAPPAGEGISFWAINEDFIVT